MNWRFWKQEKRTKSASRTVGTVLQKMGRCLKCGTMCRTQGSVDESLIEGRCPKCKTRQSWSVYQTAITATSNEPVPCARDPLGMGTVEGCGKAPAQRFVQAKPGLAYVPGEIPVSSPVEIPEGEVH